MIQWLKRKAAADATRLAEVPFDGRVPAPTYVTLETTRYCNLRCRMCLPYVNGITVSGPHMPMEVFKTFAEQLFPYAERFQPSVSGEPMMSRGIMDMVRTAASYGVKLEMCTNGTLFSEPRIRTLIGSLGKIKISFDGASKEIFESIREGAKYERVIRNVKTLIALSNELPEGQRPLISLACTLMEKNVRELPRLVRLAHELGVDELGVNHVFPNTEDMKGQSLVHHPELGQEHIAAALQEASRLGLPMEVFALDQITAATALGDGWSRKVATQDGVVKGFEAARANRLTKPYPSLAREHEGYEEIMRLRREGRRKAWFQAPAPSVRKPLDQGPIWVCDWLWSRTWAHIDGVVKPCCITGAPAVGVVDEQRSFSHVWSNRNMRVMRQRLVARDPVDFCRGCRMIREVSEPTEVHRYLGGRRVPAKEELEPVPELLEERNVGRPLDPELLERSLAGDEPIPGDPADAGQTRSDRPRHRIRAGGPQSPELTWSGSEPGRYRIEISPDGFESLVFATDAENPLAETSFKLPGEYWRAAPVGVPFDWRVILVGADDDRVIYQAQIEKVH